MKRKEKESLRTKSADELMKLARDLETKLSGSVVGRHTKPQKNSREDRSTKQKLAIIKTYISERGRGGKV